MPTIVPIVEGDGEVLALPSLLYGILSQRQERYDVLIAQGRNRVVNARGRSKLLKDFEKFLGHAQNKPDCDAVLVILDADEDCPVSLANELIERCANAGINCPVQIVCAHHEYESWFLASWDTIKVEAGLPDTVGPLEPVDDVTNPKGWIKELMPKDQSYKETSHQAPYTRAINLDLAHQNSRSFQRLCHALEQLVGAIDEASTP